MLAALFIHHTKIGKGEMNHLESAPKGAVHRLTFSNKKRHNECTAPHLSYLRIEYIGNVRIILPAGVGNCFHNCQIKNKEAPGYFRGLSQDVGRVDFAKNFHTSPFKEDLSVDTTFIQINRDGQCL
jgi:hypothetical protein